MDMMQRETVWKHKPALRTLVNDYGSLSLQEYFTTSAPSSSNVSEDRLKELSTVFETEVARLLGKEIAQNATEQLLATRLVSTADHHGPLCHPFFLNSNLVQRVVNRKNGYNNVIVLSCGGVSMNNSSFPRGLFFHNTTLQERRLHFKTLKHRREPVYAADPYSKYDIERVYREISPAGRDILHDIYGSEHLFEQSSYADQCTVSNHALWRRLAQDEDANLIYLQQETLVTNLLLQYHLEKKTILHELLFNPVLQDMFEKHFDGVTGAMAHSPEKGSFLFWGIHGGKRIALKRNGRRLASLDGTFTMELNPESIRKALTEKSLMPSMALSFIVLSFYYGLHCGGGFSQINYLGDLKNAYLGLLDETASPDKGNESETGENIDIAEERAVAESIVTNIFRGEFILATLGNGQQTVAATSLDLLLYGNPETIQTLEKQSSEITLTTAIEAMMPEFYKIITGESVLAVLPLSRVPCCYV